MGAWDATSHEAWVAQQEELARQAAEAAAAAAAEPEAE